MQVRRENPTIVYLARYRELKVQRESVLREMDAIRESSTRATSRLTAIRVSGTPLHDRVAISALDMVDCESQLAQKELDLRQALARLLDVIGGISDERRKTLLELRYVEGLSWEAVAQRMHCDRMTAWRIHGEALIDAQNAIDRKKQ